MAVFLPPPFLEGRTVGIPQRSEHQPRTDTVEHAFSEIPLLLCPIRHGRMRLGIVLLCELPSLQLLAQVGVRRS